MDLINLAMSKAIGGNSGIGGGGTIRVNFTVSDDESITADISFAELVQAYNAGKQISGVARYVEQTYGGADLASDSCTLSVDGAANNATSVRFDGGTVTSNQLQGRYVLIGGTRAKVLGNTSSTLMLDKTVTAADNTMIYPADLIENVFEVSTADAVYFNASGGKGFRFTTPQFEADALRNKAITVSESGVMIFSIPGAGRAATGISKVEQTTTSQDDGGTNVVTVTLTDGNTATFQVQNGSKGSTPKITATKSGKTTTIRADGKAIATISDGEDSGGGEMLYIVDLNVEEGAGMIQGAVEKYRQGGAVFAKVPPEGGLLSLCHIDESDEEDIKLIFAGTVYDDESQQLCAMKYVYSAHGAQVDNFPIS